MARAEAVATGLAGRSVQVGETKRCRQTVKEALESLKTAVAGGNQAAIQAATNTYKAVLAQNGWFRNIGHEVFNGVFSLDLMAGGGGENANVVRQFTPDGEVAVAFDGWTSISDAGIGDDGILVGLVDGPVGGIGRVMADPVTGVLDAGSAEVIATNAGLAGGVALTLHDGGSCAVVLNRTTGNFFTIDDPFGPNIQLNTISGNAADAGLDPVVHLLSSNQPSDPFVYVLPDIDTPTGPGTAWLQIDLGPMHNDVVSTGILWPFQVFGIPPALQQRPEMGDTLLRVSGSGRTEIMVQVRDPGGVFVDAGTTVTDAYGNGVVPLDLPLLPGGHVRASDPFGRHCNPCPIIDPDRFRVEVSFRSPTAIKDAATGDTALNVTLHGPRFSEADVFVTDGTSFPWQPAGSIETDGFGGVPFVPRFPGAQGAGFVQIQNLQPISPEFVIPPFGESSTLSPGLRAEGNLYNFLQGDPSLAGSAGLRFEVVTPPPGLSGNPFADQQWFRVDSVTGRYRLTVATPPGETAEVTFTVQAVDADGVPMDTPQMLRFPVSNEHLTRPIARDGFYEVPCLVLGGEHYPMFQFRLVYGHGLEVPEPHWHWYGFGVSSLENPTLAVPDPSSLSDEVPEGYGRWIHVPQSVERVPVAGYRQFAEIWNARINPNP